MPIDLFESNLIISTIHIEHTKQLIRIEHDSEYDIS